MRGSLGFSIRVHKKVYETTKKKHWKYILTTSKLYKYHNPWGAGNYSSAELGVRQSRDEREIKYSHFYGSISKREKKL